MARGIPAQLKLLERRIADAEELVITDGRRLSRALREHARAIAIALDSPKRIALLESRVAALESARETVSKPRHRR